MKNSLLLKKSEELILQRKKHSLFKALTSGVLLLLFVFLIASLADIIFEFSGVARWFNLVFSTTLSVFIVLKIFIPAVRYSRFSAIRDMEKYNSDAGQALRTYEQFSKDNSGVENSMAEVLKRQVEKAVEPIIPEKIVPWKNLKPLFLTLSGLVLLITSLTVFYSPFYTAAQRWFNPASQVTFTNFEGIKPPTHFISGENLEIRTKVTGIIPDAVALTIEVDGAEARKINLKPDKEGICSYEVKGLEASFSFHFSSGQAVSEKYKVTFVVPPTVKESILTVKYPEYTGVGVKTQNSLNVRTLSGSGVSWSVLMTVPMSKAVFKIKEGQEIEMKIDGRRLTAESIVLSGKQVYFIEGVDKLGQEFKTELFELYGFEDSLPQIRFINPNNDIKVTSITDVPITIKATDDFGIKDIGVGLYLDEDPEKIIFMDNYYPGKTMGSLKDIFYLEELDVSINSSINLFAFARDHHNDVRVVSDMLVVDIKPFDKRTKFNEEDNDAPPPGCCEGEMNSAVAELEELIERQRQILSKTFKELNTRTQSKKLIASLALKQRTLQEDIQKSGSAMMEKNPAVGKLVLKAVEPAGLAADFLEKTDLPKAFSKEQSALHKLLLARRKLVQQLEKKKEEQENESKSQSQSDSPQSPADVLAELIKITLKLAQEESSLADIERQAKSEEKLLESEERQAAALTLASELMAKLRKFEEKNDILLNRARVILNDMNDALQLIIESSHKESSEKLLNTSHELFDLAEIFRSYIKDDLPEVALNMSSKALSAADFLKSKESKSSEGQRFFHSRRVQTLFDFTRCVELNNLTDINLFKRELSTAAESANLQNLPSTISWSGQLYKNGQLTQAEQTDLSSATKLKDFAVALQNLNKQLVKDRLEQLVDAQEELAELDKPESEGGEGTGESEGGKGTGESEGGEGTGESEGGKGTGESEGGKGTDESEGGKGTDESEGGKGTGESEGGEGSDNPSQGGGVQKGSGGTEHDELKEGDSKYENLVEKLNDIGDKKLNELTEKLSEELAKGKVPDQALLDTIKGRLNILIKRFVDKNILNGREGRVPAKYEELVNRYFRSLSDDIEE